MLSTVDTQPIIHVEPFSCGESEQSLRYGSIFDTSLVKLEKLTVGPITYPLKEGLVGRYERALQELSMEILSPRFVGQGPTQQDAIENFTIEFHAAFQHLLYKRPFEMNEKEAATWHVINEVVDVTVYRNRTPVSVRQFGKVRYGAKPYPSEIRWEDGKTEAVSFPQVDSPDDFISFKPGQPIEAIVERNPLDFSLQRIKHIERRSPPRRLSDAEETELLESIGSSMALPEAGWD